MVLSDYAQMATTQTFPDTRLPAVRLPRRMLRLFDQ